MKSFVGNVGLATVAASLLASVALAESPWIDPATPAPVPEA